MICMVCHLRYWASECSACFRGLSLGATYLEEKSQSLVERNLDAVLMDVEQRGRLVITVFRDGGRVVRLLPPCAQMK